MIPKHVFRRLIDLNAPVSISEVNDPDQPLLEVRHRKNGELSLDDGRRSLVGPTMVALPLINAYLTNRSGDRSLNADVGALDIGAVRDFRITSKKLTAPLDIETLILGNLTVQHYNDVAFIRAANNDDIGLYEMHTLCGGLLEVDSYSFKALSREVLTALAVGGVVCHKFDPEKEYLRRYGQSDLDREISKSDAEHNAFIKRIFGVLHTASKAADV